MAAGDEFHGWLTASFDAFMPRLPGARFDRRDGFLVVSYPPMPVPLFNGVWFDGGDDSAAVAALPDVLAELGVPPISPGVTTHDGAGAELVAAACRLGLTAVETVPAMVVTPERLAVPGEGPSICSVEAPAELEVALDLVARGFDAPSDFFAAIYSVAFADAPGARVYLATVDGRPVSTALAHRVDRAVGIYNVATPPEARRRGYGGAVTARALADAFADGAEVGFLQSSEMGEGVYRALGFEQVGTYAVHSRPTS